MTLAHLMSQAAAKIARSARLSVFELVARFCEWRAQCIAEERGGYLRNGLPLGRDYLEECRRLEEDYLAEAKHWRAKQ